MKLNVPKNNSIINNKSKITCKFGNRGEGSSLYEDAMRICRKYITRDLEYFHISEEMKKNIEKAITIKNTELLLQNLKNVQQIVYNILLKE